MAFLKRLGYYMAGLAIGILILTFLLKKKTTDTGTEFCYFPNCRVLKDLRSKPISYSDSISDLLEEGVIDSTDIASFLRQGSVAFGKSDTRSRPCTTYVIEHTLKGKDAIMKTINCDSLLQISQISYSEN